MLSIALFSAVSAGAIAASDPAASTLERIASSHALVCPGAPSKPARSSCPCWSSATTRSPIGAGFLRLREHLVDRRHRVADRRRVEHARDRVVDCLLDRLDDLVRVEAVECVEQRLERLLEWREHLHRVDGALDPLLERGELFPDRVEERAGREVGQRAEQVLERLRELVADERRGLVLLDLVEQLLRLTAQRVERRDRAACRPRRRSRPSARR